MMSIFSNESFRFIHQIWKKQQGVGWTSKRVELNGKRSESGRVIDDDGDGGKKQSNDLRQEKKHENTIRGKGTVRWSREKTFPVHTKRVSMLISKITKLMFQFRNV
jgi:hypothetical protein